MLTSHGNRYAAVSRPFVSQAYNFQGATLGLLRWAIPILMICLRSDIWSYRALSFTLISIVLTMALVSLAYSALSPVAENVQGICGDFYRDTRRIPAVERRQRPCGVRVGLYLLRTGILARSMLGESLRLCRDVG